MFLRSRSGAFCGAFCGGLRCELLVFDLGQRMACVAAVRAEVFLVEQLSGRPIDLGERPNDLGDCRRPFGGSPRVLHGVLGECTTPFGGLFMYLVVTGADRALLVPRRKSSRRSGHPGSLSGEG